MEDNGRGLQGQCTDYATGIRYDFIAYQDSDYTWSAFQRRQQVQFFGIDCYICSEEDLIISKLIWYAMSRSEKQYEDLRFLLTDDTLNRQYIHIWVTRLALQTYGLLEQ